jgi:hypothetical protein
MLNKQLRTTDKGLGVELSPVRHKMLQYESYAKISKLNGPFGRNKAMPEGHVISKSFRTGRLERELKNDTAVCH